MKKFLQIITFKFKANEASLRRKPEIQLHLLPSTALVEVLEARSMKQCESQDGILSSPWFEPVTGAA